MSKIKLAIIGAHGVPAKYGGYCTLAQYLADYKPEDFDVTIYCCKQDYPEGQSSMYKNVHLEWIDLPARGIKAFAYGSYSLLKAIRAHSDCILICGSNAGFVMPFIPFRRNTFYLNIGGVEWQRNKYNRFLRFIVRILMKCAVHSSEYLIADNLGIKDYIKQEYGRDDSVVIAYGGDQAKKTAITSEVLAKYPFLKKPFAVAIARIQSDNNTEMLLDAFKDSKIPLVYIGNWNVTTWAKDIRNKYSKYPNLILLDAIYDISVLNQIRSNCAIYIHGHSAGGTNPSLVEAMHLEVPLVCYDNGYNNSTTFNQAFYFKDIDELKNIINLTSQDALKTNAKNMKALAIMHYKWEDIARRYYDFFRIPKYNESK